MTCKECTDPCAACNKVAAPPPPVCTAHWDEEAWRNYFKIHGQAVEPEVIIGLGIRWIKTNKQNEQGEALYHCEEI